MKNKFLSASILGFGLLVSAVIVTNGAFAQTAEDAIQFPVAELGGCGDKDACKTYCDDAAHIDACLAFAEKNNLMSEDEINIAKKFIEAGSEGPGGCTGKNECQAYCDDINHIDACITFAEKAGMLPPEELAEAKQVQAAIARGVKPPACGGKKACDAYCEDPSNMKECITFGEAAGFLQGKELEDARKMLVAIDNGAVPPPCRGREACDTYCSEPDNMEACMTFARAAGFMTEEEARDSEKMLVALKKGVKPPQCRGKEECDAYCTEPAHTDECINFAIAAGFMTEKEAEMAKKTGGKGPGGCVGKDACDAFCGNQDNQETCFNFAKENGMISEEDLQRMQEDQRGPQEPMRQNQFGEEGRMTPAGYEGRIPPEGQPLPNGQFAPGQYPNQPPPDGQRPPEEQFAPGTYPNQMPLPPGEGTAGSAYQQQYQQQYQEQYQQQYEQQYQQQYQQMQSVPETTLPASGGGGEGGGTVLPPPIEQTAPQSFNFDLNNALASVIAAFKEFKF